MLRTEPGSSTRAVNALNCRVIFLVPKQNILRYASVSVRGISRDGIIASFLGIDTESNEVSGAEREDPCSFCLAKEMKTLMAIPT